MGRGRGRFARAPTCCSELRARRAHPQSLFVLVSHDMRLISQVAKEIWEVDGGRVTRVSCDIMAYKRAVQARLERAAEVFEKDRRARAAAGVAKA